MDSIILDRLFNDNSQPKTLNPYCRASAFEEGICSKHDTRNFDNNGNSTFEQGGGCTPTAQTFVND